jgi:uroporphyrinogen decarboxylase
MNSRERMLAAIRHQPVDRVPTDIWATPEVWEKLRQRFGDGISDALHIDGMRSAEPRYVGPPIPALPQDESANMWGMRSRRVDYGSGTYDEQFFYPLQQAKSIDDLEAYAWPSADWFNYSQMRAQAALGRRTHVVQCGYMAPFYMHNLLRGLETSLMDPLENPRFTHHFMRRVCDFLCEHHQRMFQACEGLIDIAQVTDDLGTQSGPMISLATFREFYKPHLQRCIDLCRKFGITVMHHDDGAIRQFLPDLTEMGIQILNPIQWRCPGMEVEGLKRDFGDQLCFHGGIDNQQTLPHASQEDVRREVRHLIDVLAADKTGYILAPCHNLQSVTPIENIIAMYDEAWSYGRMRGSQAR